MKIDAQQKLKEFFSSYKHEVLQPKTTILRPGKSIDWVYYLEKGSVRQYILSQGEEISLHIFSPEAYFPMMLILSDKENDYYFESIDEVHVYKAPAEDVIKYVKNNGDISYDLAQRLAKGLTKLLLKSETTLYKDSYSRIVSILLFLASKLGTLNGEWTDISVPLTHAEIASWAGIQRETASRQLEVLLHKGLIFYDKNNLRINVEALKNEEH